MGSNTSGSSGARVSNAYMTCPLLGDSLGKLRLIPHGIIMLHGVIIKAEAVKDGCASD